jgi:hypothetical protein
MVVHETCLFRGVKVEIELAADRRYRLRYGAAVEYVPGRRTVNGRGGPYRFRSVEQLRYDFEQDVKAVGGTLG